MSAGTASAAAAGGDGAGRINSDDVFIHSFGHARLDKSPLQAQHQRRSVVVGKAALTQWGSCLDTPSPDCYAI